MRSPRTKYIGPMRNLSSTRTGIYSSRGRRADSSVERDLVTYKVLVDDNFHRYDESERYIFGEFQTYEIAVEACKKIVDDYLVSHYKVGISADELFESYKGFGEDPFIRPASEESNFSAWDYAKKQCASLCASETVESDVSLAGDTNSIRFTFDAGSDRHSNCLKCLDDFDAAADQTRSIHDDDLQTFLDSMADLVKVAFDELEESGENAEFVAERATDRLFRIVSQLEFSDVYTYRYLSTVVRELFMQLAERDLIIYYVLDNALRADRFEYVCKVFDQVGIKVITPQIDGADWTTLSNLIKAHNHYRSHVAYIEPDASVNNIGPALGLAEGLDCIATFRNEAPEDPLFQVISESSPA